MLRPARPGFTWVKHEITGDVWECPDSALDVQRQRGWELCDPPEDVDPALAEQRRTASLTPPAPPKIEAAPRGKSKE